MSLFRETADVSVRPAVAEDAVAIAATQVRSWRAGHADVLGPDVLDRIDATAVRERWSAAIEHAPTRDHRVLVACAGARVVGVAASVPSDAGLEITALEVDPEHQRAGHGSRLLTACVDLGRETGAREVTTWVLDGDGAREQFLASAGLGPDGAARTLAASADREVTERRWVAEL